MDFVYRFSNDSDRIVTGLVVLSVLYALVGGGLGLWYPQPFAKMDFNTFYEAGELAWQGNDPYADAQSGNFAYPPAWIALCALMSLLPWWASVTLWKLLNLFFLVGSVWLSLRIFGVEPSEFKGKLVFAFAFFLWPTLTTLKEGQTSLFVLFFLLASIYSARQKKYVNAGLALSLGLIKPQLAVPVLVLFVSRRWIRALLLGAAVFSGLSYVGLWLSDTNLMSFFGAILAYAGENTTNQSGNPYNIGIQNLSAVMIELSTAHARQLGVLSGLMFLLFIYLWDRKHSEANSAVDIVPLLLLSGPLFFGARSYDLVFVIPLFAWLLSRTTDKIIRWPAKLLCLSLFVPLAAVRMFYNEILADFMPSLFFELVLRPFRSWVLLILLMSGLTIYFKRQSSQYRLWQRAGVLGDQRNVRSRNS